MFAQRTTLGSWRRHAIVIKMSDAIHLTVNGQAHTLTVPRDAPLLNVLRNDLCLSGPKYGCGLGECGACSVLVDGIEARACVIPVGGVEGRHITTLEGLGALEETHGKLQAAGLAMTSFAPDMKRLLTLMGKPNEHATAIKRPGTIFCP